MKMSSRYLPFLLVALCATGRNANAGLFGESFNYDTVSTNLVVSQIPGFSFRHSQAEGGGTVEKIEGTGNGWVKVTTTFQLDGDFTILVGAGRVLLGAPGANAMIGLQVESTNGFVNVGFLGEDRVASNIKMSGITNLNSRAQAGDSTSMEIRRVGSSLTLSDGFWGPVMEFTHQSFAAPVTVSLFLSEETGSTAAAQGWFDDLDITAVRFVPELPPGVATTIEMAAVVLKWRSLVFRDYEVEYKSTLTTNLWTRLEMFPGTGSLLSYTNWVIGQPQGFYRVVEH